LITLYTLPVPLVNNLPVSNNSLPLVEDLAAVYRGQGRVSFGCEGFETTKLLAKQKGTSKLGRQKVENRLHEFL
jgi:hypothetical protein